MRVKWIAPAKAELDDLGFRWKNPETWMCATTHRAGSTITKFTTAGGRGWTQGSSIAYGFGFVVSLGSGCRH